MGLLAAVTLVVTLTTGYLIDRESRGTATLWKCRVLFAIVVLQVAVTYLLTTVSSLPEFLLWLVGCSVLLGAAIPFAFTLMLDLIAPSERGYAAGAAVGCAFFGCLSPRPVDGRTVRSRCRRCPAPDRARARGRLGWTTRWETRASRRRWRARGTRRRRDRECTIASPNGAASRRSGTAVRRIFLDSLGFVRIIETPNLVERSWQRSRRARGDRPHPRRRRARGRVPCTHRSGGTTPPPG